MELTLIPTVISVILSIPVVLYIVPYIFSYGSGYSYSSNDNNNNKKPRKNGNSEMITSQLMTPPPGSNGLPWIGETLQYLSTAKENVPEKFINDRKKKYSSDRLFRTRLLGEDMVLLCNADGNKFVFSNDNKLVTSWWPSSVDVLFNMDRSANKTEEATKMRKFVAPLLKLDILRKYVGVMDAQAKEYIRSYWDDKQVVEVHPFAKYFTFTLACRLLLGIRDEEVVARLDKSFSQFSLGLISLPINLPGTKFRRALKAANKLRKEFEDMIKKWKKDVVVDNNSSSSTPGGILCQHLLESRINNGDGANQSFSDSEIATRILALISASYDNVSTTMTFIIKYLAEMPDVYDQVLGEQMEIASSKEAGELLNWDDIQKMRYSWNVASEVLRLHPPAPGAFREVITNFAYDGFLIPKGWKLHWNAFATHKSSEYFPSPETFDPSRFENSGIVPYSYVPFGGGPHMCPGKEYARLAILSLMHNVVMKFRLEKVDPDEKVLGYPDLKPAKDLPIRLYPHDI